MGPFIDFRLRIVDILPDQQSSIRNLQSWWT